MSKIAAYVRVSTKKQSVDLQVRDIEKWAKNMDWEIEFFEEKNVY